MSVLRCPGQDPQRWKFSDISTIACPHCGEEIEFFKDEPSLECRNCKKNVKNPTIDLGCAKWCKHGDECLGGNGASERTGSSLR
ncbi:MAG: hypothetical protein GF398_06260 [Chitinivibrionales bacterium]|nr:hypothetical protein [Chitinivibrionales bacterium]